jgi:diacylglycerol kinase family enzyme
LIYVLRVTIACFLPDRQKLSVAGVTDATSVFVINATPPSMAMLSRGANASDGYMDVAIVRCRNPLQYLTAVGCLVFGAPDRSSHYSRVRVKELTVTAAVPVRPNIDGDPAEATQEMHMRLVPGAVKIVLSH